VDDGHATRPITWLGSSRTDLKGFPQQDDMNTYRAVYAAQFDEAIYVLHAFQKKSTRGIATPTRDVDLIRRRLADAERLHRQRTH